MVPGSFGACFEGCVANRIVGELLLAPTEEAVFSSPVEPALEEIVLL